MRALYKPTIRRSRGAYAAMKDYESTATIQADPDVIWNILTDAPGYSRWDSGISRIEGTIAAGSKIQIFTKMRPDRPFSAQVVEFVPGRQLVWTGGMPLGLFSGERTFTLTPEGDKTTHFKMREE